MIVQRQIAVAAPVFAGNEEQYLLDCIRTGWISSKGEYIDKFEQAFGAYIGTKHAITCCNGTVALHLALLGIGIKEGDEVIMPTLTFVATPNCVRYCGATPVFVDSEPETWNMDPAQLEAKITPRTKAIIVVHLYGHPAKMDEIERIARKHNLVIVEDSAEAHGAEFQGKKCGSLSTVSTFSFYGNKSITTGEGGMVCTDDDALAARIRQLRGQGQDPNRTYWFPMIGYNYRMTNICAAIGLAQTEKIEWYVEQRRIVSQWYRRRLSQFSLVSQHEEASWAKHSYWMYSILFNGATEQQRDQLRKNLAADGIETRPVFYPMHTLPPYKSDLKLPVAEKLAATGINLPTWAGLTEEDVDFICSKLKMQCEAVLK